MKKIHVVNVCFLILLFSLFLWQTYSASCKYLAGNTITSSTSVDDGSILFPSVTVCKKYFNGLEEEEIRNMSLSMEDKLARLHGQVWNRSEVFHFVSHPDMFNLSFPCTTLASTDTTPGKPCTFPFISPLWGVENTGCDKGYCITR